MPKDKPHGYKKDVAAEAAGFDPALLPYMERESPPGMDYSISTRKGALYNRGALEYEKDRRRAIGDWQAGRNVRSVPSQDPEALKKRAQKLDLEKQTEDEPSVEDLRALYKYIKDNARMAADQYSLSRELEESGAPRPEPRLEKPSHIERTEPSTADKLKQRFGEGLNFLLGERNLPRGQLLRPEDSSRHGQHHYERYEQPPPEPSVEDQLRRRLYQHLAPGEEPPDKDLIQELRMQKALGEKI